MNHKYKIGIVAIVIASVLIFAGCVEESGADANPSQDLIDMIDTKGDIKFGRVL